MPGGQRGRRLESHGFLGASHGRRGVEGAKHGWLRHRPQPFSNGSPLVQHCESAKNKQTEKGVCPTPTVRDTKYASTITVLYDSNTLLCCTPPAQQKKEREKEKKKKEQRTKNKTFPHFASAISLSLEFIDHVLRVDSSTLTLPPPPSASSSES